MELYFPQFVTLVLLFVLLLLLLRSYWRYKKKVAGFPYYNLLPYLLYSQVNGKISKDTPFNHVLFEKLVQLGKQHVKEGLFMTYFTQPSLFIFNEEAIKFFANEKAALDKSPEYKIVGEVLGAGIGTSNGERWKKHRKLINPAFYMGILKEKVPLFNEHAMALVKDMEQLTDKPSVDLLNVLKVHYFCSLCETILGLEQAEENKAQIAKLGGYVDNLSAMTVQRLLYPWLRWKFILNIFPSGRNFLQQEKECGKFINDAALAMKKRICCKENEDVKHLENHLRKSITYLLLNHHLNDPSKFTFEDLKHESRTIIVTGYDTATFTSMWCLFLLGLHPEIQEKTYNEIQSKTSDYISFEECSNLTYLEAVLMESLRLYPTVPFFMRNLSENIQYGKYKIFKGTSVAFFPYLSHRDPIVFPDPENFQPERFLNSELKKTWNFIPFSEGSRSCIGRNYALIEMKIFLAHILRNFKIISLDRREDIKLCWTIVLSPTKHLRFKIMKRHSINTNCL